jgi:ankyrin repeat protein
MISKSCCLIRLIQSLAPIYKNMNSVDKRCATPLHYSCRERNDHDARQLIQWLLSNGADVMAIDLFGSMPLHSAAQFGNLEAIKWLVKEYGVDASI